MEQTYSEYVREIHRTRFQTPRTPANCMICGAKWIGGHALPGEPMRGGLRVFYDCGASLSIHETFPDDGSFKLLIKNCWCDANMALIEKDMK